MKLLESRPKRYAWGSTDAIARLQGREPADEPEAELWFGDHPLADCTIEHGSETIPFSSWLSETGHTFPLLVKILAAESPLSIQVHPDADTASEGYAAEESARVQSAAPRSFVDPHPKPELIIAWSDAFQALWGVLPRHAFSARIEAMSAAGLSEETTKWLVSMQEGYPNRSFSIVLGDSEGTGAHARELSRWARELDRASCSSQISQIADLVGVLASHYPGDPGIVLALMMHHVHLRRGEGLFVPPGEIHAYLHGLGLEVMLPSDNVVRAGLTPKAVDTELFLRLAALKPQSEPQLVTWRESGPQVGPNALIIPFRVDQLEDASTLSGARDSLLVVEAGSLVARSGAVSVELNQGSAYFVGADELPLEIEGHGRLWWVQPTEG